MKNSVLKQITRTSAIMLVLLSSLSMLQAATHSVSTDAQFATVQAIVQPGEVVRLVPGDYGDLTWSASGTRYNRIIVEGKTNAGDAERNIASMTVTGSNTTFSGLTMVGGASYIAFRIDGQFIRLTDTSFDNCISNGFATTRETAYEVEIDHCSFAGKDPLQYGDGQTLGLWYGGQRTYPAGHVIHHNQFGPEASWSGNNGNETIIAWSVDDTNHVARLGSYTFEEDYLIMLNLFTRSASENEMLSAKCDSLFFLLNTVLRDKDTNLRLGRNHTMEGNFFVVNSRASRSCGSQNLFRNNYHHYLSSTHKLWGESSGYEGAKTNWIVNNSFMAESPYTAVATAEDITVVNNLFAQSYIENSKHLNYTAINNMGADVGEPAVSGVAFYPYESLFVQDTNLPTEIKEDGIYHEDFLYVHAAGSPALGAAVAHQFAGGLDPFGNPVPSVNANIGAFQEKTHNILSNHFNVGDLGPFTQVGQSPSVHITSPVEGATINGTVQVNVQASDPEGELAYVYLMLNNQPVSVDTAAPFEWTLTDMLLKYANRIRAVAFDLDGNISFHRVNVMNTAPSTWVRNTELSEYPVNYNKDSVIDFRDLEFLASHWLDNGCGLCDGADLTGDGNVKMDDFAMFAIRWLSIPE